MAGVDLQEEKQEGLFKFLFKLLSLLNQTQQLCCDGHKDLKSSNFHVMGHPSSKRKKAIRQSMAVMLCMSSLIVLCHGCSLSDGFGLHPKIADLRKVTH